MGYNLLINGVYWGYNPFTKDLLPSWDILALNPSCKQGITNQKCSFTYPTVNGTTFTSHLSIRIVRLLGCPGKEVRMNGDRINGLFHLLITYKWIVYWSYNQACDVATMDVPGS